MTTRRAIVALALAAGAAGCSNLGIVGPDDPNAGLDIITLVATPASPTSVALAWTPTGDASGATQYRVYRNGGPAATLPGTAWTDIGLTPATTYTYTVAALDGAGAVRATSMPATVTTAGGGGGSGPDVTPPTQPTSLTAVASSSSAIGLSWTASTDAAGVTGYRVFRGGAEIGQVTGTAYNDTGLSASTMYSYTVAGFDAAGNASPPSNQASATTLSAGQSDTQSPTAPASLTATATGPTTAALSWTASTDNIGVLGYRIFRNGSQVATASGTTFNDTGLTPATSYVYSVSAYDAAGNVSGSSPSAIVTTPAGSQPDTQPPTTPASLSATATSATTATLSWPASTDNVGVIGYRVFRNGAEVGTTPSPGYNDVGLSPSTTYSYTVTAYDAAGNNSGSSPSSAITTPAAPDTQAPTAPTSLAATATGSTTISLTWNASTDNVGITGYRITRNGTQVGTTSSTTFGDTGLQPSTVYTYTVRAVDAAGNVSVASNPATATTQAPPADTQPPTAPTGLSATATGTTTIALSWTASTDNVGVTGYRIIRNGSQVGTATGTSFTDTGLTPSTVYTYSVIAFDAAGNSSAPSGSATATTQTPPDTQPPTAPTSLTATPTSFSSIALNWNPSTDNVGVTQYQIFRGGVQVGTATGTTYTDTGLQPVTQYSYTVRARDAAGNLSPHSASASATTLPLVP